MSRKQFEQLFFILMFMCIAMSLLCVHLGVVNYNHHKEKEVISDKLNQCLGGNNIELTLPPVSRDQENP